MKTLEPTKLKITTPLIKKLLCTVDAGLVNGLGTPEPGKMCVEAAVCYALGLPHNDKPACVGVAVRAFKIRLNDCPWPSDADRAKGMRKLAVAQLGSENIDQREFTRLVAEKTIRRVVPIALRSAVKLNPEHASELESAAQRCEKEGTRESALDARKLARAANAAYAADAAAATSAAYAADADARKKARHEVYLLAAQIGLEALRELKSPGCEWLYLCGE